MGICVVQLTENFKIKYDTHLAYNIYTLLANRKNYEHIIRQIIENGKTKNEINITIETDALIHIVISTFRMQMFKWKLAHFEFNNVEEGNKIMKTVLQLIEIKK